MRRRPELAVVQVAALAVLAACAHAPAPPKPAETPTIGSLAGRTVEVTPDRKVPGSGEKTIAAYREFLGAARTDPQRPEAMRRLGDLEMDKADTTVNTAPASDSATPDYKGAIALYLDFLKTYPNDPHNDRVLYQLARAYEQSGEVDESMKRLDQLVRDYPNTRFKDEAQFRRGELLFSARDYSKAEQAYGTVLAGPPDGAFYERSLYMQGWSIYKQGRQADALNLFFRVLDIKLAGRKLDRGLDEVKGLTRADRELVEDTFRVTGLCLDSLGGATAIDPYVSSQSGRQYEFLVYEELAGNYLKAKRVKDAADTLAAFAAREPSHTQAPAFRARIIDIYKQAGFGTLALESTRQFVELYGPRGEFRRANPAAWESVQPQVKTHLTELALHYHAIAQKSKKHEDYQEAVRWYRDELESFPSDPETAKNNFLLAELLFEDHQYAEAAVEYEKAAYQYPAHDKSADAGYSALLAFAQQEKAAAPAQQRPIQEAGIDSALKFAKAFPKDPRVGPVLTNASEKLYALNDPVRALEVAEQVVALDPPVAPAQRRTAWLVVAHTSFDQGNFDKAERAYGEVLALTPDKDPSRGELTERVAASIYKQGEKARADGDMKAAAGHFERVAATAPQSTVRAAAQFDAAAARIALKDWPGAGRALEDFRQRFPNHPLQAEVPAKLAVVYTEQGQWSQAAAEYERIAQAGGDPQLARQASWQAAELYDKAGSKAQAGKAYEHYVQKYPEPLEPAVEARYRIAGIDKAQGNGAGELSWLRAVQQADAAGGAARTDRTRYLGATAALALAEPSFEEYRKVALVEPLKQQLKLKKTKMEDSLKAFQTAADYGVADVATAATYRIAELYRDFGRSMIGSQRPKGLSKEELEQYDVLLEEQAFPFEEKAVELHELNARHCAQGIYDAWVRKSYTALAEMRPLRYGKSERSEVAIDAIH
jgi:cellulose synthase operon protein C